MSDATACQLCGRVVKRGTTAHHLIPRACHRNKWFQRNFTREQMARTVDLCRSCHSAVHQFIPREKDLGRHFHTLEKLAQHPPIARFVEWVKRQH